MELNKLIDFKLLNVELNQHRWAWATTAAVAGTNKFLKSFFHSFIQVSTFASTLSVKTVTRRSTERTASTTSTSETTRQFRRWRRRPRRWRRRRRKPQWCRALSRSGRRRISRQSTSVGSWGPPAGRLGTIWLTGSIRPTRPTWPTRPTRPTCSWPN